MLSITTGQLRALEPVDPAAFNDYMQQHLWKHFPAHVSLLKDEELQSFISIGADKAAAYGFTTIYEACLFIDIMAMIGSGFDKDVQLPWCAAALADSGSPTARNKIDKLYAQALNYLDSSVGNGQVFPLQALRKIYKYPLNKAGYAFGETDAATLPDVFRQLWPAKFRLAGPAALRRLITQGWEIAGGFGISDSSGVAYLITMMFVFGMQVYDDPLYPWVRQILTGAEYKNEAEKCEALQLCVQKKIEAAMPGELVVF